MIILETLKRVCFQGGSKYRDIDDDGDKNDGGGIQSIKIVVMIIAKEEHSKYKNIDFNHKRIVFKE